MTKEKDELIADLYNEFEDFWLDHGVHNFATFKQSDGFKAVNEFTKHIAIQFKEWQDENLEGAKLENYDGHDTWVNPHTREVRSTSALYELFLKQKEK